MEDSRPNICKIVNKLIGEKFNINTNYMDNPCEIIWEKQYKSYVIVDSSGHMIEDVEIFKVIQDPSLITKCYSPSQDKVIKSLISLGFIKVSKSGVGKLLAVAEDSLSYSSLPSRLLKEFEFLENNRTFDLVKLEVEEFINE